MGVVRLFAPTQVISGSLFLLLSQSQQKLIFLCSTTLFHFLVICCIVCRVRFQTVWHPCFPHWRKVCTGGILNADYLQSDTKFPGFYVALFFNRKVTCEKRSATSFVDYCHMCNCIHSIYEESWSGISLHYLGSFLAQTDGGQNWGMRLIIRVLR